jgi:hypothetical protein
MKAILARLRFYLGNCQRFATIPWRQKVIAPAEACTIFACSYGDAGWHHLRRTLAEYDRDPGIALTDTTLFRFLKGFTPSSICELLDPQLSASARLPLFTYPWGTFGRDETRSTKDPWTSRFCGPSTMTFIADEFSRFIALYERIKRLGYRPWSFAHTFIGGTLLISADGRRRFVVLQGNHRMAALAHLGHRRIAVRDISGYLPEVREADLPLWPLVRLGHCTPVAARAVFGLYFEQTGWHVARRLDAGRQAFMTKGMEGAGLPRSFAARSNGIDA